MEHLTEEQRNRIYVAVHAGRRANATRANRIILATNFVGGRQYVVLSGPDGVVNAEGQYYYQLVGEHPPDRTFDFNQMPSRRGDSEFARDRQGRAVRLRTLLPDGEYKYTSLGKHFFRYQQVEHVVHIPVRIEGRRRDGRAYVREDYIPFDSLAVERVMTDGVMSQARRIARVKELCLQALGIRTVRGRTVLLEISGETYFYDRTRPWRISSLTTTPHEGGPTVHAALNRPMGHLRSSSFIPHAEHVLPEAWEVHDDKLCVIRQMAVLLHMCHGDLLDEFDRLLQRDWRDEGLTPNDIKAYCQEHSISYFCVGVGLLDSWVPEEPKGRGLAFATWDGHAYFYQSARVVSQWTVSAPRTQRAQLASEVVSQTPPVTEWREWVGKRNAMPRKPGYFHCPDLRTVRAQLLNWGRNPKITLRSLADWSSIRYTCVKALDGCNGTVVIRELPEDHTEIAAWAARLGVAWCGERLPALTYKTLLQLLKVSRRTPGAKEQAEILKKQRDRCAVCRETFDDNLEWDHEAPLKQLQGTQKQTFRAVCAKCHAEATSHEGGGRALESRFSPRAWDQYVMSPRPPTLCWKPHEKGGDCLEGEDCEPPEPPKFPALDVVRCRRNALLYSAHDWSVFCALDSIVPAVPSQLGDFSFITHVKDRRKSKLSQLPFVGQGWYHKVAAEFLLHHGICDWACITHSFSSTGRLPPDAFQKPLQQMEEAWQGSLNAKLSVNQMIGLWAKDTLESLSVKTSRDAEDGQGHWCTQTFDYQGGHVVDFVFRTQTMTNASMRAIHDQIMHTEAVRVAQMIYVAKALGVPEKAISDVKTDCIVMAGVAKKHEKEVEKICAQVGDLGNLRRKYEKVAPGQGFLNSLCEMKCCGGETPKAFRYEPAKQLQGIYRVPHIDAQTISDLGGWTELDETAAEAHVLAGKSLAVTGYGGTGKSFWARGVVQKLRDAGRVVHIISKTHVACANFGMGAMTADHWAIKYVRKGSCPAQVLVIEEFSQLSAYLWNEVAKVALKVSQFICLGDEGQLDPIKNVWAGCPVQLSINQCDLYHVMVGGFRLQMKENRRSDPPLFDFCTGLRAGCPDERQFEEALADARARFPVKPGQPDFTLCVPHRIRMEVNRQANEALKPEGAVFYKAPAAKKGENSAQDMWVYEGQTLVGAGGAVRKGIFVTVWNVTETGLVLLDGLRLSKAAVLRSLRLAHSLTIAGCQGLSLPGRARVIPHGSMTTRELYVACSRATAAELLEVV